MTDVVSWVILGAIALVPYSYIIARAASIAFFRSKREHSRLLLKEIDPSNLETERRTS